MGKRRQEEEDRIAKKIKKLERKLQRRRRVISSSDSDAEVVDAEPDENGRDSPALSADRLAMPIMVTPMPQSSICAVNDEPEKSENTEPDNLEEPFCAPDLTTKANTSNEDDINLGDDILQILGEAPQPELALGKNIHKDIASRWQDILIKGLPKETKESILKKYSIPANCSFLVAPTLNPEAKAAVPDVIAKRDNSLLQKQNQIGIALAALSQLTEMILRDETSKQALLQPLSDACRILCDSHNIETKTRRSIIMSSTNNTLRDSLINANRDKFLFGEDLAEKLKAAKSIQKTGESLQKTNPVASTSKGYRQAPVQKNRNLNSRGPIQRKPPIRNESARGRPPARSTRSTPFSRLLMCRSRERSLSSIHLREYSREYSRSRSRLYGAQRTFSRTAHHYSRQPPPPPRGSSLTRRSYRR